MSLRLRLTLLYATLTGGVFLVFAAAAIYVFNALLLDQIDNTLETSANIIIREIKMTPLGRVEPDLSSTTIAPLADFATWRSTSASGGFDLKTFEVRARPREKVDGLRPGMSAVVDWGRRSR